MNDITVYNKRNVYKDILEKKVEELKKLCIREGVPMFVSFAIENNLERTVYQNDAIFPFDLDVKLKNNLYPLHLNVLNGFKTVLAEKRPIDIESSLTIMPEDINEVNKQFESESVSDEKLDLFILEEDDDEDECNCVKGVLITEEEIQETLEKSVKNFDDDFNPDDFKMIIL